MDPWILLTQAPPSDLTFSQLGIAAVICVLLSAISWTLWRQHTTDLAKIEALQASRVSDAQAAVAREREVADKLVPLLATSAEVLSTAPARFSQALDDARRTTESTELAQLVAQLKAAAKDIGSGRGTP